MEAESAKEEARSALAIQDEVDYLEVTVAQARARELVRHWRTEARPEQLPPSAEDWIRVFMLSGGRGSGKTWAAAHTLAEIIVEQPAGEYAIVGPTFGDAVGRSMKNPKSGLIIALGGEMSPEGGMRERGPFISRWVDTKGELYLKNGSIVYCDGGDDGALRIQGANLRAAWVDEVGNIIRWKVTWDESLRYAIRLDPGLVIVTGTPKRDRAARVLVRRLLDDPDVVHRRLRTKDNLKNLSLAAKTEFLKAEGTALERQELEGELIEGAENALWDRDVIDAFRLKGLPKDPESGESLVELERVIIAIDPAGSHRPESDYTGMIVAAKGTDGHGYVLEDLSCKEHPKVWVKRAIQAYQRHQADAIVGERNHGGDLLETTIHAVDPNIIVKTVWASRGKVVRAEPIATAYAEGRVHHVGTWFGELEQQMCDFTPVPAPGGKDDRVDALVWALTELGIQGEAMTWEDVYRDPDETDPEALAAEMERNPWMSVYQEEPNESVLLGAGSLLPSGPDTSLVVTSGGVPVANPTAARQPIDMAEILRRSPVLQPTRP